MTQSSRFCSCDAFHNLRTEFYNKVLRHEKSYGAKQLLREFLLQAVVSFISRSIAASTKGNRFPVLTT